MKAPRDTRFFKIPEPGKRTYFGLDAVFSPQQGERMQRGFTPRDMDDKWLVALEDGWLVFYRSWSGTGIYGLRLEHSASGTKVVDGWVSRDVEYYHSPGVEQEATTILALIRNLFGD
jgi:hypothetical protein